MTAAWVAVVVASVGCYLTKLAGVSLPAPVLDHPVVRRVAALLPVAMLAGLVVVELFDAGGRWGVDWRALGGMAAAVVALLLRAGVLTVFVVAVVTTALLRLVA